MTGEIRAIFSSGDADNSTYLEGNTAGASTIFVPISQDTLGLAFQPPWGTLVMIQASYSVKPLDSLQLMLKGQAFLRPTTGAISATGVDLASSALYLGSEVDAIANFRPFSDLGTALSLGVFFPNGSVFTGQASLPQLAGRLEVSLSF